MSKRKKSLVMYMLKSENIKNVFTVVDDLLEIDDNFAPAVSKGILWDDEKEGTKKVRITIEEVS